VRSWRRREEGGDETRGQSPGTGRQKNPDATRFAVGEKGVACACRLVGEGIDRSGWRVKLGFLIIETFWGR
jgi:hypothetical protein